MKKLIVLLLLITPVSLVQAQEIEPFTVDELISPYIPLNELFGKRDSAFTITQYKRVYPTDSLAEFAKCSFTFKKSGVIKTVLKADNRESKPTQYWKVMYLNNEDTLGDLKLCRPNGKFKKGYPGFAKTTKRSTADSTIIEEMVCHLNKKDTVCDYIVKQIYYKGILVEMWHKYALADKGWSRGGYEIYEYSYGGKDTTFIETFSVGLAGNKFAVGNGVSTRIKKYDEKGRIAFYVYINKGGSDIIYTQEHKYFYKPDGTWYRTEYRMNGVLNEITEKKTCL